MGYLAAVTVPRYRNDRFNCGDVFGHPGWVTDSFARTWSATGSAGETNVAKHTNPIAAGIPILSVRVRM
jgi:hypothetical protein